jgi:hypothetical protein
MNSPFADGADIKHITYALRHLQPEADSSRYASTAHARTKS